MNVLCEVILDVFGVKSFSFCAPKAEALDSIDIQLHNDSTDVFGVKSFSFCAHKAEALEIELDLSQTQTSNI
jgi:hypothetical protein